MQDSIESNSIGLYPSPWQLNVGQRSNEKVIEMPNEQKVKGPASYFPSIEKTYGKPVSHWFAILATAGDLRHMELVDLLKKNHKLGHGHANALVAYHRAKR